MTKDEYFRFQREMMDRMLDTAQRKNADYTGGSPDPFDNFASVSRDGICTTEQGFLVRMRDEFSRIVSLINSGQAQVKDESVTDTLQDLANYCILLSAYIASKNKEGKNE